MYQLYYSILHLCITNDFSFSSNWRKLCFASDGCTNTDITLYRAIPSFRNSLVDQSSILHLEYLHTKVVGAVAHTPSNLGMTPILTGLDHQVMTWVKAVKCVVHMAVFMFIWCVLEVMTSSANYQVPFRLWRFDHMISGISF